MKYSLTILAGVWVAVSFGQPLADISKRLKALEQQTTFYHDTAGFFKLPRFDYRCDNGNEHPWDYYHIMDVNRDGLKDLIYSGPCGDHAQTGIFLNVGRVFRRIYDFPGVVISIDTGMVTTINMLREACCCEDYSQYIQVTIDQDARLTKNTIVFDPKTKIKLANKLSRVKVVGTIRGTPQINDVIKKNECKTAVLTGNQLTRIVEFKSIVQLNKSGPWWLVLYPENNEMSWLGWMRLN